MTEMTAAAQTRRDFLKKAAVGSATAAAVWTVPAVTSVAHAQAVGSGIPVAPGECCRVKWNTDHAAFHTDCHGDQAKDEVNRAYGWQLPDPKTSGGNAGIGDDDISPDNQCCETSELEWNDPALNCPTAYLDDVITVSGNTHATLGGPGGLRSITFKVDQAKAFECYLTDPNIMFGEYEKIDDMDCTTGDTSASGIKSTEWTFTWGGHSGDPGGKVPIFFKFMFMCGDSDDCKNIGESGYIDPNDTISL